MTLLKIKSIIYKYTGIYLAETEENIYLQSEEFWEEFNQNKKHYRKSLGSRNLQGLMIGMWQSHHGFVRPFSFLMCRKPKFFWTFVAWFDTLFKTLRWDFERLFRRRK
jgi:hypothetical protein